MRIEKVRVRTAEIGRIWLNSSPLSFRQLHGRVVAAFKVCMDPRASAFHVTSSPEL